MAERTRTALIVGASRGLGLGLAVELARRGWQVIATTRATTPEQGLANAVKASAGRMTTAMVDINLPSQCRCTGQEPGAAQAGPAVPQCGRGWSEGSVGGHRDSGAAGALCSPPMRSRRCAWLAQLLANVAMAAQLPSCLRGWVRWPTIFPAAWTCTVPARQRSIH